MTVSIADVGLRLKFRNELEAEKYIRDMVRRRQSNSTLETACCCCAAIELNQTRIESNYICMHQIHCKHVYEEMKNYVAKMKLASRALA